MMLRYYVFMMAFLFLGFVLNSRSFAGLLFICFCLSFSAGLSFHLFSSVLGACKQKKFVSVRAGLLFSGTRNAL